MFNQNLVYQRLGCICDAVNRLKTLSQTDAKTFPNSIEAAAAESYLRRALEAIFDIGRHLLSRLGEKEMAAEYKSIARGLADLGIISPELGHKLVQMAGYRNRLVHLYHQVTDSELYQILQHDLQDIENFLSHIKAYVDF